MMFEQQYKSDPEKLKASASALETSCGLSSDANPRSPAHSESEPTQVDQCKTSSNKENVNLSQTSSRELCGKQKACVEETPENDEPGISDLGPQPIKRPRVDKDN